MTTILPLILTNVSWIQGGKGKRKGREKRQSSKGQRINRMAQVKAWKMILENLLPSEDAKEGEHHLTPLSIVFIFWEAVA